MVSTLFVAVLITEIVSELEFVTYANCPSGVNATEMGLAPTPTVTSTASVAVLITATWLLNSVT